MYKESISLFERIISALSYLTFGTVGFIWIILAYFTKQNLTSFIQYHAYQSIFLSILYFIVSSLLGLIMQIFSVIPIINQISSGIYSILNMPVFFGFSIILFFINVILIYLMITSFLGQYSYLPWVSDIIKANIRR